MVRWTFVGLLWVVGCNQGEPDGPTEGDFRALTYNVHGLPSQITGDDTPERMRQIAPLLNGFDVVGLQEDFDETNHGILESAEHPQKVRFAELVHPDRFYGSGLAVFADMDVVHVHHEHFDACHGLLESASDCLASKGFQVIRLQLGPGEEHTLDVYNTHMEAGGANEDNVARASQVDQLLAAMSDVSADRAVLFLADTNLRDSDPNDLPEITRLLEGASLTELCVAVNCPEPGRIDRLLYRSSDALELVGTGWEVPQGFVDDQGGALSDHDPIAGEFAWNAR